MNSIFDGTTVSEIRDPHFAPRLSYALDTTLALLQPSRIPGKVEMIKVPSTSRVVRVNTPASARPDFLGSGIDPHLRADPFVAQCGWEAAVGKGRVVFSAVDVCSGLLGTNTWGIVGYLPEYSEAVVKNLILLGAQ